jgi:hypothetical protein
MVAQAFGDRIRGGDVGAQRLSSFGAAGADQVICSTRVKEALVVACGIGLFVTIGCGEETPTPPSTDDDSASACAPGMTTLPDGGCQAAGVPAANCASGFVPDDVGGCIAVMPSLPCAPGLMALPGEPLCRELAPCGQGTWGNIPVEPTTQFVDAGYMGGDSDGSQQQPWTSIIDGTAAASAGAIVAIAAGTYVGSVSIAGAPVRLWGRCPVMVALVGDNSADAAFIVQGASGTEVHDLAITGPRRGVRVVDASGVLVDRVWIHDTADIGIYVDNLLAATDVNVNGSLVESCSDLGVLAFGAGVQIVDTVVRTTQPRASDGLFGGAIEVGASTSSPPSNLLLRGAVLEGNHDIALAVFSSAAIVEDTLIRDTSPNAAGLFGRAIDVEDSSTNPEHHATIAVQSSVIERHFDIGIFTAGSDITLDSTVVRDVFSQVATQEYGRALQIQDRPEIGHRGSGQINSSLIERCSDVGVVAANADLTLQGSIVRMVAPRASDGAFGDGVALLRSVSGQDFLGEPFASANITAVVIANNARAGVASFGADITLQAAMLECNNIHINGEVDLFGVAATFLDLGGNHCGCADDNVDCQLLSSELVPPAPVDDF